MINPFLCIGINPKNKILMGKLKDRYIRFDWAIKRMLRDKANFAVLEGLLTVLFEDKTQIVEILESEGNQLAETDKFNRVDIKAKNSKGEIILVEVQNTREVYYLERILYGVAKTITEHISLGESYGNIKKVYSISIVYFDLGKGNDYLYHGQNRFIGVHTADELQITTKQEDALLPKYPERNLPGILHHPRERVQQSSKNTVGGMGKLPENRRNRTGYENSGD